MLSVGCEHFVSFARCRRRHHHLSGRFCCFTGRVRIGHSVKVCGEMGTNACNLFRYTLLGFPLHRLCAVGFGGVCCKLLR